MRRRRGRALTAMVGSCVVVLAVVAATALAAAGALDQSFSGDGKKTLGFANGTEGDSGAGVALQPNGKIVVAGHSSQGGQNDFAVARLNPNGGVDQSFSNDGRRTFGFANSGAGDVGNDVAIQPDGKIVVVGYSDQNGSNRDFAVARLNPNGSLDQTFSTDGRRTFGFGNGASLDSASAVAIQSNGQIVVAGESNQGPTGVDMALARLNPNGGLDQTFSADGRRTFGFGTGANSDRGADVAIQANGKLVVAGHAADDFALVRVSPSGTLDSGFSGGGRKTFGFANGAESDGAGGVAIQPNGKIVAVGSSDQGGQTDFAVARLNPTGSFDQGFSTDGRRTFGFANGTGEDVGHAVAIQPNGRIVMAGSSNQSATGFDFAVARLNANGSLDQTLSTDGRRTFAFANGANIDSGRDVAIQAGGKIVVAGNSVQSSTGGNFAVARLLGG